MRDWCLEQENIEVLCFSEKIFLKISSFSLEKGLLFAKKDLSLRHAPAGSRVRMICRGVEPGA